MKKLLLTTTALFLFLFSQAQDWQPFHLNDEAHFAVNGGNSVANTIKVTDETTNGTTTTYNFNKIVAKCVECTHAGEYYTDQPQFLGYKMEFANGVYTFQGKDTFIIDANVKLNGSWTFNFNTGVTAEVTEEKEVTHLGMTDSVRVITLSDGGVIELGKQLGVISFEMLSGSSYRLIGEEDKAIGEHVPTFKDFFNYKPGDVLVYRQNTELYYFKSGGSTDAYFRYKIIDVLHHSDDSVVYEVDYDAYISRRVSLPTQPTKIIKEKVLSSRQELVFKAKGSTQIGANYSMNELVPEYGYKFLEVLADSSRWEVDAQFVEAMKEDYAVTYLIKSINGDGYYKIITNTDSSYGAFNHTVKLINDSTLVKYNYQIPNKLYMTDDTRIIDWSDPTPMVFKEGIGFIQAGYFSGFEGNFYVGSIVLEGASIDGNVYGNLQPNGFFALSTNDAQQNNNLSVYPNPATNQVSIQLENYRSEDAEVKIYNVSGQVVASQQHNFSTGNLTMDVATLPKGIYYVKVEADNVLTTKKLVIY